MLLQGSPAQYGDSRGTRGTTRPWGSWSPVSLGTRRLWFGWIWGRCRLQAESPLCSAGAGAWGRRCGTGWLMGLWQPPVQPRLCSLPVLRVKEGWCKIKNHVFLLSLVCFFSLNNEVTNIEYLLSVHWLWLRGAAAAWLHEHVQRLCWVHSGALWGWWIWLFLKKISKLFVYWEGMAFFVVVRLSSARSPANVVYLFCMQISNLLSNGI